MPDRQKDIALANSELIAPGPGLIRSHLYTYYGGAGYRVQVILRILNLISTLASRLEKYYQLM